MKQLTRSLLVFLGAFLVAAGGMLALLTGACLSMLSVTAEGVWLPVVIGIVPAAGGAILILVGMMQDRDNPDAGRRRLGRALIVSGILTAILALLFWLSAQAMGQAVAHAVAAPSIGVLVVFGIIAAVAGRILLTTSAGPTAGAGDDKDG